MWLSLLVTVDLFFLPRIHNDFNPCLKNDLWNVLFGISHLFTFVYVKIHLFKQKQTVWCHLRITEKITVKSDGNLWRSVYISLLQHGLVTSLYPLIPIQRCESSILKSAFVSWISTECVALISSTFMMKTRLEFLRVHQMLGEERGTAPNWLRINPRTGYFIRKTFIRHML